MKPGTTKIGPYIITHTVGASPDEEFRIFRESIVIARREVARLSGIPWSPALEVKIFFDSEREAERIIAEAKAHGISDGLRRLLAATKKKDAEKEAAKLVISKDDIVGLKLNCNEIGLRHRLFAKEFLPPDIGDIGNAPAQLTESGETTGPMSREAKKHFKKVDRIFEQRKQRYVHLLENETQHHFFFFDYSDIGGGHYAHGPHLHYCSHLWNVDKEETYRNFQERNFRPPGTHIRVDFEESKGLPIKSKVRR